MSGYTVRLSEDAENDLALIWLASGDRRSVTRAESTLAHLLALDPFGYGQEISEGLYAVTVPPLRAYFEIDPAARTVDVTSFHEMRRS